MVENISNVANWYSSRIVNLLRDFDRTHNKEELTEEDQKIVESSTKVLEDLNKWLLLPEKDVGEESSEDSS